MTSSESRDDGRGRWITTAGIAGPVWLTVVLDRMRKRSDARFGAQAASMFEITVQAGFSSGHFLRDYYGKCENPHGHNYRVLVTLMGAVLEPNGLLLDFKLLKQVLRPTVDYLDHKMINDLEPFTTVNPSAENLAKYFFEQTAGAVNTMTQGRVRVKDCTIFETDTSFARYYE